MKAVAGVCRVIGVLMAAANFSGTLVAQSRLTPADAQTKADLRAALTEARAAVIRLSAEDRGTSEDRISEDLQDLVGLSRRLDDPEFVRYLQQHLAGFYPAEISHALDPGETREDFARRIAAAPQDEGPERESVLESIATQQLDLAMCQDALDTAGRLTWPIRRRLLPRIATTCYQRDQPLWAGRAIDAVIRDELDPNDGGRDPGFTGSVLASFAYELNQAGDADDARRVLSIARSLALSSANLFTYAAVAEVAARLDDRDMALELLESLPDGHRQSVEDALKAESIRRAGRGGLEVAATIDDDWFRSQLLVVIAEREADAGNRKDATAAFDFARKDAYKDAQFAVFHLIDIAKAQFAAGDEASARATLSEALAENEKPYPPAARLHAWSNAAALAASMGDFARAQTIAARIDGHAFRVDALRAIAYHQTAAAQYAAATRWAGRLKDTGERSAAFLGIAEAIVNQMKKRER